MDEVHTSRLCTTVSDPADEQQFHSFSLHLHSEVRLSRGVWIYTEIYIGMCAFGIIIGKSHLNDTVSCLIFFHQGDTIPQVVRFAFPGIMTYPFLSLLGNRQFVIALCIICVSYPLSLYRDISKLSRASGLALIGMVIIVTSVLIESPHVTDRKSVV